MSGRDGSARCDGFDIAFRLREGDTPTIVFLHGLGCSKRNFLPAFDGPWLARRQALLAIDMPGHGASSARDDFSYELQEQAALLAQVTTTLGIREVVIVAHSMGGAVGLLLAELLSGVRGFCSLEGNLVAEHCKVSRRVASVDEQYFVERLFPMAPLQFRCRGLESEPPACPRAFHRAARSLVRWSQGTRLLKHFRGLEMPKAYLYGALNQDMAVLKQLEACELALIPGSGHFMMLDNPELTYGEIRRRMPSSAG